MDARGGTLSPGSRFELPVALQRRRFLGNDIAQALCVPDQTTIDQERGCPGDAGRDAFPDVLLDTTLRRPGGLTGLECRPIESGIRGPRGVVRAREVLLMRKQEM